MARRSHPRSPGAALLAAALALTLHACLVTTAAAAGFERLRIVAATGNEDYGEVGNPDITPAISGDGRFVAYVPKGGDEGDPLMLRDLLRGTTVQVAAADGIYHESVRPSLSGDGRYLAFDTNSGALFGEPNDRSEDRAREVFVYDRIRRAYTLVSRRSGRHGAIANYGDSTWPSISADGRHVAFETSTANLSDNRRETIGGIYERDLDAERLRPVSAVPGIQFWRPGSYGPALSGDGRRVAFTFEYGRDSYDPEHPPADIDRWLHRHHKQVVLKGRGWKRPLVVSRASGPGGALSDGRSREAAISGTGRYVAFVSRGRNLVGGDRNGVEDVFVRDVRRARTTLVSSARGEPVADGSSTQPSISADGRYVAFLSEADNLLPGDGDAKPDVYVKDMRTGHLTLVTRGLRGESSDGRSGGPAISADGRFVAFGSTSSNLDPEAPDHQLTYYRYRLR